MPFYALHCLDKPGALDLRMKTREAHLAYVGARTNVLRLGGPLLDEAGAMAGSLMVVEVETRAEAEAFSANDPYTLAGLWARVDIKQFRTTLGSL